MAKWIALVFVVRISTKDSCFVLYGCPDPPSTHRNGHLPRGGVSDLDNYFGWLLLILNAGLLLSHTWPLAQLLNSCIVLFCFTTSLRDSLGRMALVLGMLDLDQISMTMNAGNKTVNDLVNGILEIHLR